MARLRALRAHGGAVLTLGLVVTTLVCAVVVVVGLATSGGGRAGIALPLLVLAVLAVPTPALELARRRRDEVALARLRGAHGAGWVAAAAGQPATAALAGAGAGTGIALLLLATMPGRWGTDASLGADEVRWAVAAVVVPTLAAASCGVLVSREPLATALRRPRWRPPTGVAGLGAGVALAVSAAAAGYLGVTGDGDPSPLVLAGSGLVAAAAGVATAAAHRAAGPAASTTLVGRPVGQLVGLRSALASGATVRTAAVVAAAVLAASALGGAVAARSWAADSSTIRSGAPLRFELPDDHALGALTLTERLDPEGRWLMAAAVDDATADDDSDLRSRVAWLDLSRYEAVMAGHLGGTPGALGEVAPLREATGVEVVTGDLVELSATPAAQDEATGTAGARPVEVTVRYLDDEGAVAEAPARFDPSAGTETVGVPVRNCAVSCVVLDLSATAPVTVEALRLGGNDLLAAGWATADGEALGTPLRLPADEPVVPLPALAPVPMLVAGNPEWPDTGPEVQAVGGDRRPVQEVAERDALPLVVGGGLVGDLRVGLAGASASVPALRVLVLARADLPDELRSELAAAGADPSGSPADPAAELDGGSLTDTRSRLVVGVAAAVVLLLLLLCGTMTRLRSARVQRAALRLAGVAAADLRRAVRVEAAVLAVVAGAVTALGSWLAVATTVDGTGLVPSGPVRLPIGTAVSPLLLCLASGATAVAVGLVALAVAGRARRRSAPAVLLAADGRRAA